MGSKVSNTSSHKETFVRVLGESENTGEKLLAAFLLCVLVAMIAVFAINPLQYSTLTPTPTPTHMPTQTPALTPKPFPDLKPTPYPTQTLIPTQISTPTSSPFPKPTPSPSQTLNPVPTSTPTPSPVPTSIPTLTPTPSPTTTPTLNAMVPGVLAHSLTADQANLLSLHGINWIRADVSLNQNESWDSIYQFAKDNNLSLIGTLLPRTMNFNSSFTLDVWSLTVQTVLDKYGDHVAAWEIWNEPTAQNSTCGYFSGTAQQYVDLLSSAYAIIKAHSDATVLGFGGLPLFSGNEPYLNESLIFAKQVIDLGGMNYCDAISLHATTWGHYDTSIETAYNNSLSLYRQMTSSKEVWITETGQKSTADQEYIYSQQEQADYLNASFTFFKSQNVSAYIWYELTDSSIWNEKFGLYTEDFTAKTALYTYFDLLKNSLIAIPQVSVGKSQSNPF
jgi:hypothetical protein